MCIVIRYFGGIKLGANGLVRAYTKSCANAIKVADLKELVDGINITVTFPYTRLKEIDYLLKDLVINSKSFDNLITYNLNIEKDFLNTIINNHLDYQIIKYLKIEK